MDPIQYCKYLYRIFFIPVYLYNQDGLVTAYPQKANDFLLPETYLNSLKEINSNYGYIQTNFFSYTGVVQLKNIDFTLVIGPVNDFPYSKNELEIMFKEYAVNPHEKDTFIEFVSTIPQVNISILVNALAFTSYTWNLEEIEETNPTSHDHLAPNHVMTKNFTSYTFSGREEGNLNQSYQIEQELIHYIETGNTEKLKEFVNKTEKLKIGVIANDTLRQWKNTCIVLITLCTRAAIRGGLPVNLAYSLSDVYFQQAERAIDVNTIKNLTSQAQFDFTNKVAQYRQTNSNNTTIRKLIDHITTHLNEPITVSKIAELSGLDRSYLTKKFKKETGITPSQYIRNSKLEEAKNLLSFSDKSISEISNYLYFSSQSHFQKAFKDYTGITPDSFRNSYINHP